MLTFQQKLAVIESFPELERHDVSLGRVNFHYPDSCYDKKNVVYHLHPNGNGFVYAGFLSGYETDAKDMVNIRDYSADELRSIIQASIRSLSADPSAAGKWTAGAADVSAAPGTDSSPASGHAGSLGTAPLTPGPASEEVWSSSEGEKLTLLLEDELWNLYYGSNLESAFETYEEAEAYLLEEGFQRN
jgi:hypothetical protein